MNTVGRQVRRLRRRMTGDADIFEFLSTYFLVNSSSHEVAQSNAIYDRSYVVRKDGPFRFTADVHFAVFPARNLIYEIAQPIAAKHYGQRFNNLSKIFIHQRMVETIMSYKTVQINSKVSAASSEKRNCNYCYYL